MDLGAQCTNIRHMPGKNNERARDLYWWLDVVITLTPGCTPSVCPDKEHSWDFYGPDMRYSEPA